MREKFQQLKAKIRTKAVKSEVKAHVKKYRYDYIASGLALAATAGYYKGAKRRDAERTSEMAKEVLGSMHNILLGISKDVGYMADHIENENEAKREDAQLMMQCIDQGRDFVYHPGVGVQIREEGYVPVVKLKHLPAMSTKVQKAS